VRQTASCSHHKKTPKSSASKRRISFSFILGGFQLGQAASGDELKHWLLMVKSPDQWIDMWHKLKPEQYHSTLRQRDSQTSR
jgi:hypothetical protein